MVINIVKFVHMVINIVKCTHMVINIYAVIPSTIVVKIACSYVSVLLC